MIVAFLNKKFSKPIGMVCLLVLAAEVFYPATAYALTSGPVQPEMQSFEPVGTTDMVNLFSGDFNYNIPLLDVEGYPVNIAYHAGITMEQEASWVGLGWNINPGEINHTVRGVSDDYAGDKVKKTLEIKEEDDMKFNVFLGMEISGLDMKGVSDAAKNVAKGLGSVFGPSQMDFGINFNNYSGVSASIGKSNSFKIPNTGVGINLGATANTQSGADFDYSLTVQSKSSRKAGSSLGGSASIGGSLNSREGLRYTSFGASLNMRHTDKNDSKNKGQSPSSGVNQTFIPIGLQNYVPVVTNGTIMKSFFAQLKVGGEIYAVYPFGGGSFSQSKVEHNSNGDRNAYGYFYLDKASSADMVDFTRDKDGSVNHSTRFLPPANLTYDIYSVNGQGTGGNFRPFRNDVGTVFDPLNGTEGENQSHMVELGLGNTFEAGYDLKLAYTQTGSGPRNIDYNKFKGRTKGELFEPFYFKQAGELTESNVGLLPASATNTNVLAYTSVKGLMSSPISATKRVPRANLFYFLTAKEASYQKLSLMPDLLDYSNLDGFKAGQTPTPISREAGVHKPHHASEFTQVLSDGRRYVYGLPVMNKFQRDYEFSTAPQVPGPNMPSTVSVTYNSSKPIAYDGGQLTQKYYSETETPAYAHAYLLTAIVSPDYSDLTGNGLSDDDLGSYTRFNYSRKVTDFNWRAPYAKNTAQYDPGVRSNCNDDKANFSMGSREVWLLHSIESKNYVAEFFTSPRKDGLGSDDPIFGSSTPAQSFKLDSIVLFNKEERFRLGTAAEPVKTVVFNYTYSLCPGVPNFDGSGSGYKGKLTLEAIYIKHGTSDIGYLSPYRFKYGPSYSGATNPSYNLDAKDCWGGYKPANANVDASKNLGLNFSNLDFPYINQNDPNVNDYAGAWNLTDIILPSGGYIKVTYESDDYAYVQDKYAMEMFKVEGMGPTPSFVASNALYGGPKDPYLYVYFKRRPGQEHGASIASAYLNGGDILQYTYEVEISGGTTTSSCSNTPLKNLVKGYAKVTESGICSNNNTYAYLKLEPKTPNTLVDLSNIGVTGVKVNPITVAAINFARYYDNMALRPESQVVSGQNPGDLIKPMISSLGEFLNFFQNQMKTYLNKNKAKTFTLDRSYVRLVSPGHVKKGGGHRVKQLAYYDSWEGAASTASYGYNYDYTTKDELTGYTISSGVASYEPLNKGDENPCRTLINTTTSGNSSKFPPVDPIELIQEGPIGESLYPPGAVGYSKVTVSSIHKAVAASAQAVNITEFYTAKDFPVKVDYSDLEVLEERKAKITDLYHKEEIYRVAQGYVLHLNDMHGKVKQQATWVDNGGDPDKRELVSYTRYEFFTKDEKTLDNNVPCLDFISGVNEPKLEPKTLGEEVDFTIDTRRRDQVTNMQDYFFSFNMFLAPPIPVGIPLLFPKFRKQSNEYSSLVNTKVIQRYGILKSVETYDKGAIIKVENAAYDPNTGQVLITKVNSEYNDVEYSVKYPAYWAYRCMGSAYENILYEEDSQEGIIKDHILYLKVADLDKYNIGDELELDMNNFCVSQSDITTPEKFKVWVVDKGNYQVSIPNTLCSTVSLHANCADNGNHLVYETTPGDPDPNTNTISWSAPDGCVVQSNVQTDILSLFDNYSGVSLANLGTYEKVQIDYNISGASWHISNKTGYFNANIVHSKVQQKHRLYEAHTFPGYSGPIGNSPELVNLSFFIQEVIETFVNNNWVGTNQEGRYGTLRISIPWNKNNSGNPPFYNYYTTSNIPPLNDRVLQDETLSDGTRYRRVLRITFNDGDIVNRGKDYLVAKPIQKKDTSLRHVYPTPPFQWPQYAKINSASVKVIRSGKRNQLTETVQEIQTLDNPVDVNNKLLSSYPKIINASAKQFTEKAAVPADIYDPATTDYFNEFVIGKRGNYRPWYTLLPHKNRSYSTAYSEERGMYAANSYWGFLSPTTNMNPEYVSRMEPNNVTPAVWYPASEVRQYSAYGNDLEVVNATGVHNSVLTGYNHKLPIATVSNASWNNAMFENFEDYYGLFNSAFLQSYMQFYQNDFRKYLKNDFPNNQLNGNKTQIVTLAHTGNHSLLVKSSFNCNLPVASSSPYDVQRLNPLTLLAGKKYIVSCWQYVGTGVVPLISSVRLNGLVDALKPKTPVIDGWVLYEAQVTIPSASSVSLSVDIANPSFPSGVYVDDLRILPVESNMKGYVYDESKQRLMAILDENHLATLFEYSAEGKLQRVKKETEKGVVTLKESRESLKNSWVPFQTGNGPEANNNNPQE